MKRTYGTTKTFTAKSGKYKVIVHESSDGLGIIIDKFLKDELTDTRTIWYADLEG